MKNHKGIEMLSNIIVSSYKMLLEISLWLFLLMSIIAGWSAQGFLGAIVGLISGFVFAVMFFGAFLILSDIRTSVRNIEELKK